MTFGLVLTAFTFGLRHGVDWDHIAAIADLSSSAPNRRKGFWLSFLYASGHAVVVILLGVAAIIFGASLPEGADAWLGRVVGLTLVGMGVWIVFDLIRSGRDFRLRSRWILILGGTFGGLRRVRDATRRRSVTVEHVHEHEHEHEHDHETANDVVIDLTEHEDQQAHDHSHSPALAHVGEPLLETLPAHGRWTRLVSARTTRHQHNHSHELSLSANPTAITGNGTAAGIGVLHGIGFESPTQIAIFVASTSVAGAAGGFTLLLAWVAGLLVANSALALLASFGLLHAERNFTIYAVIALIVGVASVAMGSLLFFGVEILPDLAS